MTQTRHPRGVPTGGQFAAQTHAEAGISLADPSATGPEATAPAPSYPVGVARPPGATILPSTVIRHLKDPPPAPQLGCDWTDPTRDLDAQGDLDHNSWRQERSYSVQAVINAAAAQIESGAPAPRSAVHAIEDWEDWARERWKATGDPYYPEFHAGLTAGRLALTAESQPGVTLQTPALDSIEEWTEEGTMDQRVALGVINRFPRAPIDQEGVRRWVDAVEMSHGGVTTGGQDGCLMVGRLVGGVPAPAPPR